MSKIICFGATGYTGRLLVEALVNLKLKPFLAARNEISLKALSQEFGNLDYVVADVNKPHSLEDILNQGDILISTVGPFLRYGDYALELAYKKGCHYIDSTGEPGFIKKVFIDYKEKAKEKNLIFLTAMGYDYVPGHILCGFLNHEFPKKISKIEIGYFFEGGGRFGMSQGTAASIFEAALEKGLFYENGQHFEAFGTEKVKTFMVKGKTKEALILPGSEGVFLPNYLPHLNTIHTYLGWAGKNSKKVSFASKIQNKLISFSPYKKFLKNAASKKTSQGKGPSSIERQNSKSIVVAESFDNQDNLISNAIFEGPNGYVYTAQIMAWAAKEILEGKAKNKGAISPLEAFGYDNLLNGHEINDVEIKLY